MGLAQADFPRQTGILDRRERRRTSPAIVAADRDDVGACFGNAGGDNANACAGNELHADAGVWIDGTQVVNQLREVFDAIDVVVRRR